MSARILLAARIALAGLTVMLGLALTPAHADPPGSSPGLSDGSVQTGNTSATSVGKFGFVESNGGLGSGSTVGVGRNTTGGGSNGNGGGGTTTVGPQPTCFPFLDVEGVMEIPPLSIDTDPPVPDTPPPTSSPRSAQAGLVGVPTWFWNPSYDGSEIKTKVIPGSRITCPQGAFGPPRSDPVNLVLHAWPVDFEWDFGDGQHHNGQCGSDTVEAVCPADALGRMNTSDLQHIYESSSPDVSGYHVTLHVQFGVDITIDGGAPTMLPPIDEFAEQMVPVRQVQSVLVPVPAPGP